MSELAYYYCSMNTFTNIINNQELWMAEPSKQNDYEELTWFTNYILPYADPKLCKNSSFKFFLNDGLNGFPTQYISCFTIKEGDKLSCWRGYGDDGCGVSIGFDLEEFKNSNKALKTEKIIYLPNPKSKNERRKILTNAKKEIQNDLNEIKNANNCSRLIPDMVNVAIQKAIKYKNIAFSEENEIRLIYTFSENDNQKVYYRSTEKNILRYIKVKIPTGCIKKIIIGPRCNADISTIQEFVQINSPYVEVDFSKASYRKV